MADRPLRYPNLYLAGAPKCGTTSLADWLVQHPAIFAPLAKEPLLFAGDLTSEHPRDPAVRCRENFAHWQDQPYALDATTHYFYSPSAPQEIAAACPQARIYILLRNPVEAVHSMFHQLRFNGTEVLETLEQSLDAEAARAGHLAPLRFGYPENLLYGQVYAFSRNISRFADVFGRDRVRVLLLDDLKSDPRAVVRSIFADLGLDPAVADGLSFDARNAAKQVRAGWLRALSASPPAWAGQLAAPFLPREMRLNLRQWLGRMNTAPARNPPLLPETRARLAARFRPEITWLENWLDRDLSHWLSA